MSSDGDHFVFDQLPRQRSTDRHSPPTLDEGSLHSDSPTSRRPEKLFLPRQGSVDYSRYEQILKKTRKYETISDLPYHLQEDVKECLNSEKESRTDWRGVASRMGVKTLTIEKIERDFKDDPTKKLFKEISNQKITKLLQVLYQMDRHDILNVFFDNLCINTVDETRSIPPGAGEKREKYSSGKFPSQESTPVSGASEPSSASDFHLTPNTPRSPFKDTGTPESAERSDSGMGSIGSHHARSKTGSFAKQNTDEDLARRSKSTVKFHSSDSEQFWCQIPPKPASTRKEWKQVEEAFKKNFKNECKQSQVMRMICYVLKIEPYEERHNKFVHDHDFANLVAWFGPVKAENDGLFFKIADLIKTSVTYKENTGPHSYFAGYMSKEEADAIIAAEKVGTFLIRFSSTFAENGSFVVVLKTNTGPEHVLLEGNPETGKIKFNDKEYDDLPTLYRHGLCKGGVSADRRVSCIYTCPNLPLNAMFKPYGAGPRPQQSFGRGRGRGRGQEQ